jgi:hypothetical protein
MSLRRLSVPLLVVALAALLAALPAAAKNGVKATLTTRIPVEAKPGTQLRVAWTLGFVDDNGRRQPFGGGGVFVRLRSATGAKAETGFADGSGAFAATVVVPEGGIGDVEIGIRGLADGRPSDLLFPITNDPLPGPARVTSPAPARVAGHRVGGGTKLWIYVVAAVVLVAMAVVAVAAARRKRASRREPAAGTSAPAAER